MFGTRINQTFSALLLCDNLFCVVSKLRIHLYGWLWISMVSMLAGYLWQIEFKSTLLIWDSEKPLSFPHVIEATTYMGDIPNRTELMQLSPDQVWLAQKSFCVSCSEVHTNLDPNFKGFYLPLCAAFLLHGWPPQGSTLGPCLFILYAYISSSGGISMKVYVHHLGTPPPPSSIPFFQAIQTQPNSTWMALPTKSLMS